MELSRTNMKRIATNSLRVRNGLSTAVDAITFMSNPPQDTSQIYSFAPPGRRQLPENITVAAMIEKFEVLIPTVLADINRRTQISYAKVKLHTQDQIITMKLIQGRVN